MTQDTSDPLYRAFFDHSLDGVLLTAPDGSIFAANPAACKLLGRSAEEISRLGRSGIMEAGPGLDRLLEERKVRGSARGEVTAIHHDGRRIPVEVSSEVFVDPAGNQRSIIVMRDLTEQKKIAGEKERYMKLFRLSTEPMCIADPFGCFLHVNPAFVKLTGYTERELSSHPFVDFVHPDDKQRTIDEMKRQVAQGPSIGFENRYICRDGRVIHLSWFAYFDETDNHTYATARDVTDALRMNRELTDNERKYRSLVTAMAEGVVFQDAEGKIIATNPAAQMIEGRGEAEMLGKTSSDAQWGAIKDDGSPFPGDEHPAMVTLRTGQPQENVVMGIKRPSGERRWLTINAQPLFTEGQSKPYAVVTTFHDITERRRMQEELQNSENLFRTLTESTSAGIYIVTDDRFIECNPAMCDITGYPLEELKSMPLREIFYPDDRSIADTRVAAFARGEQVPAQYEIRILRKDNQVRWVNITSATTRYLGKRSRIGTVFDITENKNASEEISRYLQQLEGMTYGTLEVVAKMVDLRDPYTAGHQRRVGLIAAEIGHAMGLDENKCRQLQWAGMVHDIGKIGVPVEILSKPTRLTALEYDLVRVHAQRGYEILHELEFPFPIAEIIWQHHERLDGTGYPQGLKGKQICPEARILAVADVIESISSHRPYRPALGIDVAIAEITEYSGTRYDPQVVEAAVRLIREKGYTLPQ
ncbi:MAG: PAS domain S-box protein [Turneriella sp.]